MKFTFLADREHAIPMIANWYFAEWGHITKLSVEATATKIRNGTKSRQDSVVRASRRSRRNSGGGGTQVSRDDQLSRQGALDRWRICAAAASWQGHCVAGRQSCGRDCELTWSQDALFTNGTTRWWAVCAAWVEAD